MIGGRGGETNLKRREIYIMADNLRVIVRGNTMTLCFMLQDPWDDTLSMQVMHIKDFEHNNRYSKILITGENLPQRWIRFMATHKYWMSVSSCTPMFVSEPDDDDGVDDAWMLLEWMNRQLANIFSSSQLINVEIQCDAIPRGKYVTTMNESNTYLFWRSWIFLPPHEIELGRLWMLLPPPLNSEDTESEQVISI